MEIKTPEYTYMYVGYDLRKVSIKESPDVRDTSGNRIGSVLICVTDTAIGIHNGRIFSVASPDKPKNFVAKGLCCGFVKTAQKSSSYAIY